MKAFFTGILLMLASFTLIKAQEATQYEISTGKSNVRWNAKKVTGEHNGLINVKRGYVLVEGEKIKGGTIFMNMTSIRNLDIEDEDDKKRLEDHLKSEDFFNSKKFPECVFKIYEVTPITDEKSPYNYLFSGSLTIKGYTHPIAFPVKVEIKDKKVFIEGQTDVDRTLYDIKYGSGKFFDNLGDDLIFDMFTISFKIAAFPPEE